MTRQEPIVYFGSDTNPKSVLGLKAILSDGWKVAMVISYVSLPQGFRGRINQLRRSQSPYCRLFQKESLSRIARQHAIPVSHPKSTREVDPRELRQIDCAVIISNGWPKKIPSSVFRCARMAAVNCHSSYLPEYRGGNVTFAPLINRESQSGVTVHEMTDRFDDGRILAQRRVTIDPGETPKTLNRKRADITGDLLLEALAIIDQPAEWKPNPPGDFYNRCTRSVYQRIMRTNRKRERKGLSPLKYPPAQVDDSQASESVVAYWDASGLSSNISSSSGTEPALAAFDNAIETQLIDNWLCRKMPHPTGSRSIDIGAGYGRFTPVLQRFFSEVVLLEPAQNLASKLKETWGDAPSISIVQKPLENYAPDHQFDFALCSGVFYLQNDLEVDRSLQQCKILLKDRGLLLIRDFVAAPSRMLPSTYIPGKNCHYRSPERWQVFAAKHGYAIEAIFPSRVPWPFLRKRRVAALAAKFGFFSYFNNATSVQNLSSKLETSNWTAGCRPTCAFIFLRRTP